MKWTRVEKHWQELASKASAEARKARLKASPQAQAGAELGTRDPESAVNADPNAPPVDVQQAPDASGESKH